MERGNYNSSEKTRSRGGRFELRKTSLKPHPTERKRRENIMAAYLKRADKLSSPQGPYHSYLEEAARRRSRQMRKEIPNF